MVWSYLVKFWALLIKTEVDCIHRRQVTIFETLINDCVPNLNNRDQPKGVILSQWLSFETISNDNSASK